MQRLLGQDGSSAGAVDNVQQADKSIQYLPLNTGSIPSIAGIKAMFAPNTMAGQPDIITDKLYDSRTITASATNNLTFFNTATTDYSLSNVTNPNQLPSQEAFYVTGIRHEVWTTDTTAGVTGWDVLSIKEILRQGYYTFTIGNKPYIGTSYLLWFLNCNAPLALNTRFFTLNPFKTWTLPWRVAIPPLTTFTESCTLVAPAAINNEVMKIRIVLEGFRYRAIQ